MYVQHLMPAHPDRVDYFVQADIQVDGATAQEQMPARLIAESEVELCCIPFFTYGLALGDQVEIDHDNVITRLLKPSGHIAVRLFSKDSDVILELLQLCHVRGWLHEVHSHSFVGIDAPDEVSFAALMDIIETFRAQGVLAERG